MKKLLNIITAIFISACAGNLPMEAGTISNEIKIENDSFKNQTWIKTPL